MFCLFRPFCSYFIYRFAGSNSPLSITSKNNKLYKKIISIVSKMPQITSIEQLKDIPGIGAKTLEKIEEILKEGTLKVSQDLVNDDETQVLRLFS